MRNGSTVRSRRSNWSLSGSSAHNREVKFNLESVQNRNVVAARTNSGVRMSVTHFVTYSIVHEAL